MIKHVSSESVDCLVWDGYLKCY